MYVRPARAAEPEWLRFLRDTTTAQLPALENMSTAALLILEVDERFFAFSFGFGGLMLRPDSYERDFGLKVTLNSVDENRLRSVDANTVEEVNLQTQRQASRGSSLDAFGLDVTRELLRSVTGDPRDTGLAKRLGGSDALAFVALIRAADLPNKCRTLLRAYGGTGYRERFPWIDHIRVVAEPELIAELDQALVSRLAANDLAHVSAAPPEPLRWEDVRGFTFSIGSKEPELDIDLEVYLSAFADSRRAERGLQISDLKHDQVQLWRAGHNDAVQHWSLYSCLIAEVIRHATVFILSAGRWHRVEPSFAASTRAAVAALRRPTGLRMPRAGADEAEADYNIRAAAVLRRSMRVAVLDRQLVRLPAYGSPIEPCDLLTAQRHFIHVKRRTHSSTLSHLFAQGLVSGRLFAGDATFRAAVRELVDDIELAALFPTARPAISNYEVVYIVIAGPGRHVPSAVLPFFSLVNLANTARDLGTLGFRVTVDVIGTTPG
jgi:uncharacterized protein (TIGR04141 family)